MADYKDVFNELLIRGDHDGNVQGISIRFLTLKDGKPLAVSEPADIQMTDPQVVKLLGDAAAQALSDKQKDSATIDTLNTQIATLNTQAETDRQTIAEANVKIAELESQVQNLTPPEPGPVDVPNPPGVQNPPAQSETANVS